MQVFKRKASSYLYTIKKKTKLIFLFWGKFFGSKGRVGLSRCGFEDTEDTWGWRVHLIFHLWLGKGLSASLSTQWAPTWEVTLALWPMVTSLCWNHWIPDAPRPTPCLPAGHVRAESLKGEEWEQASLGYFLVLWARRRSRARRAKGIPGSPSLCVAVTHCQPALFVSVELWEVGRVIYGQHGAVIPPLALSSAFSAQRH